jgi:hypothetical protein
MVGLEGETNEERCKEAGIDTLERRYLQAISQTFKIINGIDKINLENLFQLAEVGERTRTTAGHLNLLKKHARTDIRRNTVAMPAE